MYLIMETYKSINTAVIIRLNAHVFLYPSPVTDFHSSSEFDKFDVQYLTSTMFLPHTAVAE